MARHRETESEAVNADSFLDIVASVVSIMIIMVMMTGLKIKNTPVALPPAMLKAATHADPGVLGDLAAESALRADIFKTEAEVQRLQHEALARQQERDLLAVAASALQRQSQATSQQIAAHNEDEARAGRTAAELRTRLAMLERQRVAIASAPAPTQQVENYPTPLSRTVEGREVHFRLSHGRLAWIPLDSLIAQFRSDAKHKAYRLQSQQELTETFGPDSGFRFRYTLERVDTPPEEAMKTGHSGSYARLKLWTLIPVSDELGETVDEALAEGSQFHRALAAPQAKDATVTLWVYPDSFDAFRLLKKDLYRLNFPVAARPLPDGAPICGSPDGTRSAAE